MPKFCNIRDYLKVAYIADVVDDAEFVLLYDTVKSKNRDLPYWLYNGFDLDSLSNCECEEEFRFSKNDIFLLYDALNIPEDIICYNGTKINGIEGLCIFLKRFAYPCRYSDMIPRFGRSVPELCLASNYVMDYLYANYHHKLTSLNQPWLAPACLEEFCAAIHLGLHFNHAGDLLMAQYVLYVDLVSFRECCTMDINVYMPSNFNQLLPPTD